MTTSKKMIPANKAITAAKAKSKPMAYGKSVSAKKLSVVAKATLKSTPKSMPKSMSKTKAIATLQRKPQLKTKLAIVGKSKPKLPLTLAKRAIQPHQPAAPAREPQRATANNRLRIFQIHYQSSQLQQLDPAFEPYNNAGDNSPLLEFNVFRKLLNSNQVKGAELWGALSWKFTQKTGLSGSDLHQIIATNPGFDVYYCNPYPELEAQYHNLWLQGETAHPNFNVLCQEFFEVAGLDADILKSFAPSSLFAAANYFVATPRFWRAYMAFVDTVVARAEGGMSKTAKAMIYSSAADRQGIHAGASYLPFIVERLFSVFLSQKDSVFSAYKFSLPAKENALNVHLKLLKQMKDVAIKSRSLWMATCWVNYRNLYMSNNSGSEWCKRYLRTITPTEFKFLT